MLDTLQETKRYIDQLLKKSPTVFINCFTTFTLRRNSPGEKEFSFSCNGEIIPDSMKDLDEILIFSGNNALGFMFGFDFSTKQFVVSFKDMAGTVYDGRTDFKKELKDVNPIFENWSEYDNKNIQELKLWFNHEEEGNDIPAKPPDIIIQDPFDRLREHLNSLFNDKFSISLHTDGKSQDSVLYLTSKNNYQLDKNTLVKILKEKLIWEDLYQYDVSDIHVRSEELGKTVYTLEAVDYLWKD
jgi:hypothetical protein